MCSEDFGVLQIHKTFINNSKTFQATFIGRHKVKWEERVKRDCLLQKDGKRWPLKWALKYWQNFDRWK